MICLICDVSGKFFPTLVRCGCVTWTNVMVCFLPARRKPCAGNSHHRVSVCVCVCLFVTRQYCIKTAKRRITQTTPYDSPWTLVFWRQNSLVDGSPSPSDLRSKWPATFQTAQFRPIFAHSTSTVRAGEKSSISTNRKSSTRFPTSHRWTVYVSPNSPKGWHKTRFCYFFLVNFNFCCKSDTKYLCVKTASGKVVDTSFLYLTVHRWIATSPSTKQVRSKWPTPSENADFDRFRLIVPQPWALASKIQLALIGSRQRSFRQATDKPCASSLNPPKGGSKRQFLRLALPFISSLQVIVDIST